MTGRIAVFLIVGLFTVGGLASDQQAQTVKIGVAVMSNVSTRSANGKLQRDRLIRQFQSGKKKKHDANDVQIIAVPLDASSPEDLGSEARDKGCDYVLYTTVVELRTKGDPLTTPRPGGISIGSDPLGAGPDPRRTQDEFWHATVEFKLVRASDPQPRLTGSRSSGIASDEISAVTATLTTIANRVKAELRSPKSVQPQ